MRSSLMCILMFLVSCSAAYAGGMEIRLTLPKDVVFPEEVIAAGIVVVNTSTSSLTVSRPVAGSNAWIEVRDSSGTYLTTRPAGVRRSGSGEMITLSYGESISLEIPFSPMIKAPVIPVTSTSAAAGANERMRTRLSGANLQPGDYFFRAVYLTRESSSSGTAPPGAEIPVSAIMSNKERVYVKAGK